MSVYQRRVKGYARESARNSEGRETKRLSAVDARRQHFKVRLSQNVGLQCILIQVPRIT